MNQIAKVEARLPMPQGVEGIEQNIWQVLCESVFPSAKTPQAIVMAWHYCKARKLDILKKPVNIVPMWSRALKKQVETVWPSINEVQVTASRTGQYAGMDAPVWGAIIERKFKGNIKGYNEEGDWEEGTKEITLLFPESCSVTVYRMINGVRCPFTEPVFWLEAYARLGKTEVPNGMWQKRPRGQFLKVAKAFSIRAAFPEEGDHIADEMEGHAIEDFDIEGVVIDNKPKVIPSIWKNAKLRNDYCNHQKTLFQEAISPEELNSVYSGSEEKRLEMESTGNDHDLQASNAITQHYEIAKKRLENATPIPRAGSEAEIRAMQGYQAEDDDVPAGRWADEPASYAAIDLPKTQSASGSSTMFSSNAKAQRS